MVTAVVGANWGDEGKGKITDVLASSADVVIRFQGGANAGHTIKNSYGKFALHTLPSGVFHPDVVNIIGNGVALDPNRVEEEVEGLVKRGVPAPKLMISDRAQIVMSYHVLFDALEEARLAGRSFGSTKSGIAPFYKAIEYYNQAIELDDDKSSIAGTYYLMASLYFAKDNYDRSRSCLQKCLQNNPNRGDAYILMAQQRPS